MTKPELVAAMAMMAGATKADTERMLNAFILVVQEELKAGNKVRLDGLGVWAPVTRAARASRNPQTGAPVDVPAKNSVSWKPGKELKRLVNE